jgi:HAE1 family hydrophobic/amphiphilic exporter-1/multidrug efflux pump
VPLFFYWLTERKISEQRKQQAIKDEIAQHHENELNVK